MSREQIDILTRVVEHTAFPRRETRVRLAESLGVAEKHVRIWFQNQRQKCKRLMREAEDQIGRSSARDAHSGGASIGSPMIAAPHHVGHPFAYNPCPSSSLASPHRAGYDAMMPTWHWQARMDGTPNHTASSWTPLPPIFSGQSGTWQTSGQHSVEPLCRDGRWAQGRIGFSTQMRSHYEEDMQSVAFRQQASDYYPALFCNPHPV